MIESLRFRFLTILNTLENEILPTKEELVFFMEVCSPYLFEYSLEKKKEAVNQYSVSPEESEELRSELFCRARKKTENVFGKEIYFRALLEISNHCIRNCLYCGIRRDNINAVRFRLTEEEIYQCCEYAYFSGFRTIVLQGGEDPYFSDSRIAEIVRTIKKRWPDCAVTLSVGERSYESYKMFREAGADRYLLRHESADPLHYAKIHPSNQLFSERKRCLYDLKALGFQTGAGFMVGSPFQTEYSLVEDIYFLHKLKPEMIGIGPFIPHAQTPFAKFPSGNVDRTLVLMAMLRLLLPHSLLPSTTALGTAAQQGRERGILAGANVIMPNLSPEKARSNYCLYDNILRENPDEEDSFGNLKNDLEKMGYQVPISRGDFPDVN